MTEPKVLIERGDWRIVAADDHTHAWILNIAHLTLERRTTDALGHTHWTTVDTQQAHTQDLSVVECDIGRAWLTLLATDMIVTKG